MINKPIQPVPPDCPGPHALDTHGYRAALNEIITMGTDFARLLHAQATAHPQAAEPDVAAQSAPAPEREALALQSSAPATQGTATLIPRAAAFDQIARAVRRSITLARSLDRPLPPTRDPAHHRTAARQRIIRDVEDRIGRATDPDACDTSATAADLHAELRDRLDAPDLDDDLATRPIPDIITEICRDLGIAAQPGTNPWRRRTPADLAHLRARAAAPTPAYHPGNTDPANPISAPRFPNPQPKPRAPDPWMDQPSPNPQIHPNPVHAANNPPMDPASIIAAILHHPTQGYARWHQPPGD